MEAAGVADDRRKLTILRAIDKLDKFGVDGVRQLLGKGRLDESGDFTRGAELGEDQIERIAAYLATASRDVRPGEAGAEFDAWRQAVAGSQRGEEGVAELELLSGLCLASGYGADRIRVDASVVRGLEYYTGPVCEAELLAEIPNEEGRVVRFGSVGGGGRYDGLVSRFRGEPVPATGFSIGVSRLLTALKALGKVDAAEVVAPVVVLVMDRDTESLGRYQRMVSELRRAGIRAEMYLGGAGMKAQLKYADRRGSPAVVIQGADERAAGTVQVKDLVAGARLALEIEDNAEWRASRPAQLTVPEGDMVATVRKVLDDQAAERAR
jgi:histidyl-tRNA synthetase